MNGFARFVISGNVDVGNAGSVSKPAHETVDSQKIWKQSPYHFGQGKRRWLTFRFERTYPRTMYKLKYAEEAFLHSKAV